MKSIRFLIIASLLIFSAAGCASSSCFNECVMVAKDQIDLMKACYTNFTVTNREDRFTLKLKERKS